MAKAAAKRAQAPAKSTMRPKIKRSDRAAETAARESVIVTAREMSCSGLSPGRSGNVSQRFANGMLITPSGMAYESLKLSDIVFVADDGTIGKGQRKPSSEWQFHLSAYHARPDGHAIVHTHSLHATIVACIGKPIPAFHYMVAIAGGKEIPCLPYATFGTSELAELVANGLTEHNACLMANHGQITIAPDLAGALELAREVETIAHQYTKLLAITTKPPLLSDREMTIVLERFKAYGQTAQGSASGEQH